MHTLQLIVHDVSMALKACRLKICGVMPLPYPVGGFLEKAMRQSIWKRVVALLVWHLTRLPVERLRFIKPRTTKAWERNSAFHNKDIML